MSTITKTATLMTAVRNGYTSTPSGHDIGGAGPSPEYNNSLYMTFPSFGLPAGSVIDSAHMHYTMTGWDYSAAVVIDLACAVGAGTPASQVATQGANATTSVPASTLISVYDATNAARKMFAEGDYWLKMYCANGNNRKHFSATAAYLDITYHAAAPNAPTITSPVTGASMVATQTSRVYSTFSSPSPGDTPSKSRLAWCVAGTGAWAYIDNLTPVQSIDIPAGDATAGTDIEIKTQYWGALGTEGPYCSTITLHVIAAPAAPTITDPTVGQTVNTSPYSVEWAIADQDAYQLRTVADSAGSPDTGTIYKDTGEVTDAISRTAAVAFDVNGRTEHVQLRVKHSASWGDWATCKVTVAFTAPAVPIIEIIANSALGRISIQATNSTSSPWQPAVSYEDIYRAEVVDLTGAIRIKANNAPGAIYFDYAAASGVEYYYFVRAFSATGTYADSGGSEPYTILAPTTDTGWATYLDGSRLFLPAETNTMLNPKPVHTANLVPATWWTYAEANSTYTWSDGGTHGGIVSKHVNVAGGAGCNARAGILLKAAVNSECAPGETWTILADIGEGSLTGCTLYFIITCHKDDDTYINTGWSDPLTVGAPFVTASTTFTTPALCTKFTVSLVAGDDFGAGDIQDYSICKVKTAKGSIAEPWFDGDTTEGGSGVCAWAGTPDASTSTRTASDLLWTGYAEITSAGVVAAGSNVAYYRNDSGTYYGPVIVVPAARSAGWQADAEAAWDDLEALWAMMEIGDMLLPLVSDGVGYLKL